MGGSPGRQRSPGRTEFKKEDTATGCPHVPKDEPAWKKTILAEHRAVARAQKKKKVYDLLKKGQAVW